MLTTIRRLYPLLLLLIIASRPLFAQRDAASLEGRVVDISGATVANATITAVDTSTNFSYHAVSDSSGAWTISPVRIGTYRITISAQGFKTTIAGPISLDVQQRQRVDATLQLGETSQSVEVHDTAPLLQTDTSETGQVVNAKTIVGLPLNGRNSVQLAQLTVGVTVSEPGARDSTGFGFSASGSRSLDNNFLLDGVDNNSNLPDLLNEANYVVMPPPDALQEFKIETGNYDAEFGRSTGAIVNATTKGGSNQFHGVAYEFLRNQNFDAMNYYDQTRQPYQQNQFGATLGGRIIRDKLFFFVDYQGLLLNEAQSNTSLVPTAAQRAGDFSSQLDLTSPTGFNDCNGKPTYQGELFDTRQTQATPGQAGGYCGVPFGYTANGTPINIIPGSSTDSLGSKLVQLFPSPNTNGLGYNYQSDPVTTQTVNQGDVRIDQVFSAHDTAFYRFSMSDSPTTIGSPFPGLADGGGFFDGIQQITAYSGAASEAHVFSPHKVNELRVGFNRLNTSRYQFNYNTDISAQVGFPGVPNPPGSNNGGLPQMTFSDVATLGSPTFLPAIEKQTTYTMSDTFTLISGNVTWKFGGEIRPEQFSIFEPASPRGSLSFGTQYTDNPASPGSGGSGLATLLTGQPGGGNINNLNNIDYSRHTYALFLQNDWRATPKLSLNLGLRYEYFSPVFSKNNAQANFNPYTGVLEIPKSSNVSLTPTLASILPVDHNASNSLIGGDYKNLSPRVGLAYELTSRLAVQSAFGVFFNGDEAGPYSNPSPGFNPPYFASQTFVAPCALPSYNPAAEDCSVPGISTLAQGFPSDALSNPNTPTLFSLDPNLRTPYVMQWHLTFQYQLTQNTAFETSYVGSKGNRLYIYLNGNQASPTADPSSPTAPRRPFPYIDAGTGYLKSAGFSNYNGLQTSLQHRLSRGLSLIVNYTYSKSLGNASSADLGAQNNDGFRWSRYPNREYGPLDFDVRNRFVASYQYDLPFGQGERLATGKPIVDHILAHWNWSGIVTLSSGTWYTVTDGNGNFANSDGQQRPDMVPGQKANGKPCIPGTFFNTCAFTNPVLGSFGNVSMNSLEGPGEKNVDFALLKTIPIKDSIHLELRAEAFNAFNHPNFLFAAPGPQNSNNSTVFGTPTFGYVTGAQAPRLVQFAAKFYY
ncbi:carboxypeptidase family protein [Acidipila rosea]|uniref:Carboxypeptidase family protein n=1 Tax=Acidipila rosea TaxID=768535 RepID=A0A4V2PVV1_9BACT|nr:carboxypeptidase family protein [Acidipila rosea]